MTKLPKDWERLLRPPEPLRPADAQVQRYQFLPGAAPRAVDVKNLHLSDSRVFGQVVAALWSKDRPAGPPVYATFGFMTETAPGEFETMPYLDIEDLTSLDSARNWAQEQLRMAANRARYFDAARRGLGRDGRALSVRDADGTVRHYTARDLDAMSREQRDALFGGGQRRPSRFCDCQNDPRRGLPHHRRRNAPEAPGTSAACPAPDAGPHDPGPYAAMGPDPHGADGGGTAADARQSESPITQITNRGGGDA